jgi:hypothetical protein
MIKCTYLSINAIAVFQRYGAYGWEGRWKPLQIRVRDISRLLIFVGFLRYAMRGGFSKNMHLS